MTIDSLPMGAKVAAVFADAEAKRAFVQRLLRAQEFPSPEDGLLAAAQAVGAAGYVSQGTTLLSGFSVLDNLRFPALCHRPNAENAFMGRVRLLCRVAGIAPRLLARQTQEMNPLERLQATYLQALAAEPELLVFDNIFEGLGAAEQAKAAALAEIFHRLYPLRRSIYLGYAPPPDHLYCGAFVVKESLDKG